MARVSGIQRRWMVNIITVVLLILMTAVTSFSVAISGYFYSSMSSGLESKVRGYANMLRSATSESAFLQAAWDTVEGFEEKNWLELQFLDENGYVLYSTAQLTPPGSLAGTQDVANVLGNNDLVVDTWSGASSETGERIMSASATVTYSGRVQGVVRIITSLQLVDRQVMLIVCIAVAIGLLILAIVYFTNLLFVRSIVEPLVVVTDTTKRIASGSYGIQIEKEAQDEIGELISAIDDMSLKIAQAERMKSEFISSVSHELRTPLTAINGWAETIQSGELRNPEDVQKGMGIIVSEARRLTNMVEELLEFSRIEDGRFTLSVEPVDIQAELEDAVYTYREFFKREGIELHYNDNDCEFDPIEADPERMRQVFCNLMDNAAKHGGAGKQIDVSIAPEWDSHLCITIRDYGVGIPEDELPHVKYKFYKGSSKARGSGIGLAVCEEIITRHNGVLELSNAEGGGCAVRICLPLSGT